VTGLLLLQLAFVALNDAEAIEDHYAWPRKPLTDEEQREAARIRSLAARLFYRASEKGYVGGTDEAFGGES